MQVLLEATCLPKSRVLVKPFPQVEHLKVLVLFAGSHLCVNFETKSHSTTGILQQMHFRDVTCQIVI
jgi:hypothetical protein